MKRVLLLIPVIALLGTSSCVKKKQNTYYTQNHFSATFDNYFNPGETGIMIFLSDLSGNLLAQASIEGQYHVNLYPAYGTSFPDLFVETLVYTGPESGGKSTVYLYSYLQVKAADWIWTTFESGNADTANLSFSGIPPQTGYSVSSKSQWIHGGVLPSSVAVNLWSIPDNIYILLNTSANGYRYKWLTGVGNSGNYPVNLSSTSAALTTTIPIPLTSSYYWQLSGYLPSGEHAKGYYTLDSGDHSGSYADSITLHYPETLFADYDFFINTIDPSDPHKEWYQYNFGTIPSRIDHLDGSITVLDSLPDHFRVQTTGTYDRLGSSWLYNPTGAYRYEWNVYGSPTATSFVFPKLPATLVTNFPGLNSDSLKLSSVEIKDFTGISSYADLIVKMFESGKYIANIVPKYSALVYHYSGSKTGIKRSGKKSF
ncbi:MAG: hypothetical protein NTW10_10850 [Bacteroidetes bacterium]|nr:hypothetical protein [Bacteroidota bacterium]